MPGAWTQWLRQRRQPTGSPARESQLPWRSTAPSTLRSPRRPLLQSNHAAAALEGLSVLFALLLFAGILLYHIPLALRRRRMRHRDIAKRRAHLESLWCGECSARRLRRAVRADFEAEVRGLSAGRPGALARRRCSLSLGPDVWQLILEQTSVLSPALRSVAGCSKAMAGLAQDRLRLFLRESGAGGAHFDETLPIARPLPAALAPFVRLHAHAVRWTMRARFLAIETLITRLVHWGRGLDALREMLDEPDAAHRPRSRMRTLVLQPARTRTQLYSAVFRCIHCLCTSRTHTVLRALHDTVFPRFSSWRLQHAGPPRSLRAVALQRGRVRGREGGRPPPP